MLDFYIDRISEKLKAMHEHFSYEEMGRMLGIATSNVARMVNGSQPIKNPSLDLFLKVFPDCKIFLEGNPAEIPSATLAEEKAKAVEDFRQWVISEIIASDIPAEKAMELLKKVKGKGK